MSLTGRAEETLLLVSLYFFSKIGRVGGGGLQARDFRPPALPSLSSPRVAYYLL